MCDEGEGGVEEAYIALLLADYHASFSVHDLASCMACKQSCTQASSYHHAGIQLPIHQASGYPGKCCTRPPSHPNYSTVSVYMEDAKAMGH